MISMHRIPRIVTAALRGGSGKTLITVGLIAAIRSRGMEVAAFKKGPDYIDAGWLGLASQTSCRNLDAFLFDSEKMKTSFFTNAASRDFTVIEGNRGLFDGVDANGSYSTAEMAKFLTAPVVLIIDATKMTRTAAALALGAVAMDPQLKIAGVILNRVAGTRHERILRDSIESETHVPVIGSVWKISHDDLPQRHLGLLPLHEHPEAVKIIDKTAEMVKRCVDVDKVLEIGQNSEDFLFTHLAPTAKKPGSKTSKGPRIGIIRDEAFQFYYPENLEALTERGAELIEFSALRDNAAPQVDALYIGGGFPEVYAERLAAAEALRKSILTAAESGLPIYAECGGLMYLSESIEMDHRSYPMVGVFPAKTIMRRKPQGLGYITVETTSANPFFAVGAVLSGHEFHYSELELTQSDVRYAFKVLRGAGMGRRRDGILKYNALGTYLHTHALGTPIWAESLLRRAAIRKSENSEDFPEILAG